MYLRQTILTNEEDSLYDANVLKLQLLYALETTIEKTTTHEELLEWVTFSVSNESERPEKPLNIKKSDTTMFFIEKQSFPSAN